MKFQNIVNKIIKQYIFPSLNIDERSVIIKCVIEILNKLDYYIKLPKIYENLTINSYRDIYLIVSLIIPHIDEEHSKKKHKLRKLQDFVYYKKENPNYFTNLMYNLPEHYIFSKKDIIENKNKLINETIPLVINNLHVNWIDILPNLDNNTGFHTKVSFQPKLRNKKYKSDKDFINDIQKYVSSIVGDIDNRTYDKFIYYLISEYDGNKEKKTYQYIDEKYDYFEVLRKDTWFTSFSFYWLAQLNFFHHFINNRIIFLTAGTGVGKSTQTPKLILYASMLIDKNYHPNIIISQPRQMPTENTPDYIAKQMGVPHSGFEDINYIVQYKHKDKSHIPPENLNVPRSIKYVTDQILFNELIRNISLYDEEKQRNIFDYIIIDESHEHNINMDLILTLLKETVKLNKTIKVFILSATMDDDEARYRQFYKDIYDPSRFIDRRLHLSDPVQKTNFTITEKWLTKPILNYMEEGINRIMKIINGNILGDILFFVPGEAQIREACTYLNQYTNYKVISLPLARQIDSEMNEFATKKLPQEITLDRKDIFEPQNKRRSVSTNTYIRKIIVSTKIAEASVTVENLKFIVDSGFTKDNKFDPEKNINMLITEPVSFSSHRQRRGRVGRVSNGYAYYLYRKEDIINNKILPQITRNNIADQLFDMLKKDKYDTYGYSKEYLEDICGKFYIVHPNEFKLERDIYKGAFNKKIRENENILLNYSFNYLKNMNLIDANGYKTKIGDFLYNIGDINNLLYKDKIILMYSLKYECINEIIIILTFYTNRSINNWFTDVQLGLEQFKHPKSDLFIILNIYKLFLKSHSNIFMLKYSIQILTDMLREKLLSDPFFTMENFAQYFTKYAIKYKISFTNKNIKELIEEIENYEKQLIKKWCNQYNINSDQMIGFIRDLVNQKYFCNFILSQNKIEILNLLPPVIKTNNIYSNCIKCILHGYKDNIAILQSNGTYMTKYGSIVKLPTLYNHINKIVMSLTTLSDSPKYILYQDIQEKDNNYTNEKETIIYLLSEIKKEWIS